jgi:hypothetical protein
MQLFGMIQYDTRTDAAIFVYRVSCPNKTKTNGDGFVFVRFAHDTHDTEDTKRNRLWIG